MHTYIYIKKMPKPQKSAAQRMKTSHKRKLRSMTRNERHKHNEKKSCNEHNIRKEQTEKISEVDRHQHNLKRDCN